MRKIPLLLHLSGQRHARLAAVLHKVPSPDRHGTTAAPLA